MGQPAEWREPASAAAAYPAAGAAVWWGVRPVLQPPPLLWPAAGAVYHSGSDWAEGGMEPVYISAEPGE